MRERVLHVRDARASPYRLALRAPLATARGPIRAREGWLLALEGTSGLRGFGEAAPLPSAGTESAAHAERALRAATARLAGAEGTPEALLAAAVRRAEPGPAVRFALESALLDLAAREAGKPLAAILAEPEGRAPRAEVPASALLGAASPEALTREASDRVAAGFGTLKVKLSCDAPRDAERLRSLRRAVGPEVSLRGDANGAWSEGEAIARLRALAPFELELVEQPLAPGDPAALARVRAAAGVPVAADEDARTPESVRALLEARAVDALVLKPAAMGGMDRALATARLAADAGVPCTVTSLLEGAVGVAAALHTAAALPGRLLACGLATRDLLAEDLAEEGPRAARGRIPLSEAPGLGVTPTPPRSGRGARGRDATAPNVPEAEA